MQNRGKGNMEIHLSVMHSSIERENSEKLMLI